MVWFSEVIIVGLVLVFLSMQVRVCSFLMQVQVIGDRFGSLVGCVFCVFMLVLCSDCSIWYLLVLQVIVVRCQLLLNMLCSVLRYCIVVWVEFIVDRWLLQFGVICMWWFLVVVVMNCYRFVGLLLLWVLGWQLFFMNGISVNLVGRLVLCSFLIIQLNSIRVLLFWLVRWDGVWVNCFCQCGLVVLVLQVGLVRFLWKLVKIFWLLCIDGGGRVDGFSGSEDSFVMFCDMLVVNDWVFVLLVMVIVRLSVSGNNC